jgi:hypothetical protein
MSSFLFNSLKYKINILDKVGWPLRITGDFMQGTEKKENLIIVTLFSDKKP